MKQISPFLDKVDVEHHVGTSNITFPQEAKASELPPPESSDDSSEKAGDFLTQTSEMYRHSAANARAIANFAYLGSYDLKSQQEFSIVYDQIVDSSNTVITHIKNIVEQEKISARHANGKQRGKSAKRDRKTPLAKKQHIPVTPLTRERRSKLAILKERDEDDSYTP